MVGKAFRLRNEDVAALMGDGDESHGRFVGRDLEARKESGRNDRFLKACDYRRISHWFDH